ncbi:catalase HPII [Chitinophaga sp. sic0106]|uniref:catalase HPII n=1 Tax=Chitinophaga sp. sic0106 TaxID=2854785 RepID=UPI001C48D907|nr:catalase HPII [Chitinophaga sp. sic0106]MBV7533745.1 catalase HPII [Chitinophaga sp. sic0106]
MQKKQQSDKPTQKDEQLTRHTEDGAEQFLTTNQGVRINDNQNSLKAGERGATLMEDFIFREKMTHFDHERIPERVVHARGEAAHGYFQVYESMAEYTKAGFLTEPARITPVFVRFSTVAGSRGSSDLARDVRGFAVKFYTAEGNYDLVGNNMPVFFIQDAMKFPDFVHAVKPEPRNEMPQAASAHDTFWDYVSISPESTHMVLWVMSDRAIPRSLRMMEGFGVHTFRFVNEAGKGTFVKFHWKPLLGVHSVAWDEAQKISGKDPDFHRRDLWDAIEAGDYPEWELGVQLVPEEDEHKYPFDLLDPTKIIPEEVVPVQRIGKMVLNRNPDNFFAETEQVAFHPGHVVPGIDFTNDPLLQGRLFSYNDTQLIRLGGPNFAEIPINRPIAPVHNNQRDGYMRQAINRSPASYEPNTVAGGCPYQAMMKQGGYTSYQERVDAHKVRGRSESFFDHFSQAALFFHSQSEPEKLHIINAFRFELGKVSRKEIRQRMLGILSQVDIYLAEKVAEGLGMPVPEVLEKPINRVRPADAAAEDYEPKWVSQQVGASAALSMANTVKDSIKTRKVAFLVADGVDVGDVNAMKGALVSAGAVVQLVAMHLGDLNGADGQMLPVDQSFLAAASVLFDAVYVPGGADSVTKLTTIPAAVHFVNEAYKHCKAVCMHKDAIAFLRKTALPSDTPAAGLITGSDADAFMHAIAQHRFWEREAVDDIPA